MPEEICLSQYEKQIAWDQFPFSLIYLGGYVALVTSSWGSIFVFPDILVGVLYARDPLLGINSRFP